MRYLIAFLAIVGLAGCAGVAEHVHVKTGVDESCDEACSPGVCRSAVDQGVFKTKRADCASVAGDLCVCTLGD